MITRRFASFASTSTKKFSLPKNIRQLLEPTDITLDTAKSSTVSGWITSIRKQKRVSFAVISDGSTSKSLQAVLINGKDDNILRRLTNGAAVRLTGQLVASPGSGQSHELLVDEKTGGVIEVLGECDPETYPIQKKALTPEYLRDHAHLRARTAHIAAMLRLRDVLGRRINSWFEDQGFCSVNTPIITASDCEGAGEAFKLSPIQSRHPASTSATPSPTTPPPPSEFFNSPAYLTVSHQLHLEALATSLSRVYTLSPCFRAEPSDTSKHLAEFWMLEAEWAFPTPDGVLGVCDLTEALIRSIGSEVRQKDDLEAIAKLKSTGDKDYLANAFESEAPWARMTYTEAVKELQTAVSQGVKFEYQPQWGRPLQSEHELYLAETLIGGPVFVTDYPATLKPFYMRLNPDEKTVACFDLLVPHIGELVGGSVREERADILERQMREAGLIAKDDPTGQNSSYKWYLDLRKFGGAPHAGFGMGFERLVGWLSGVHNIRECIPMPRWAGRMLL
ncbi:asparaginyl-tRNA synthetase [Crepidotus variabilis]|uniref:Asparagine--tRNA ligase, mitochondrial n=1 Tax=Crepidotus variabilis TaxID=179855 RepID=A0A9P6EP92_9AGAR|nr:asparaginyl-tRNA synthetase [Crepidotus variabilis]